MKGIPLHPLRIAALDRMTVLRVPFDTYEPRPEYVYQDTRPHKASNKHCAMFWNGRGHYKYFSPYSEGKHFLAETWRYYDWTEDGEPWIQYRCDGTTRLITEFPEEWVLRLSNTWIDLSEKGNVLKHGAARDSRWRSPVTMPEIFSRYIVTLGPPVPCRLGEVDVVQQRDEGVIIEIGDEYRRTWDALYPKHPFSPDRWTWGYPMEVRR